MPHEIFERYPPQEVHLLTSAGELPTPYHVYDGHAVLIGGTADLEAVRGILHREEVAPVQTEDGRALMAIWAVDETKASHGPHTELQVSFYVSHQPMAPITANPFALLNFLLTNPGARQMCHGLWNNTPATVAYNREVLGLTPQLARSDFTIGNDQVTFSFHDVKTGDLLVEGQVHRDQRPSLGATAALFRSLGVRGAMRAASMKIVEVTVVNPINERLRRNADARTLSASDSLVAQLYDPQRDRLTIEHPLYGQLGFDPTFVEHMTGFKMVYLSPE